VECFRTTHRGASSVSLLNCPIIEQCAHPECAQRLAERKLGSTVLDMIKELELSMGAQVFIAVGYRSSDGTINKAK
jgi:hypothetical protein